MKYLALLLLALGLSSVANAQDKLENLKKEVQEKIDDNAKMAQVIRAATAIAPGIKRAAILRLKKSRSTILARSTI